MTEPNEPIQEAVLIERGLYEQVVEGLRALDVHCDRIAVLSKCPGSAAEAGMAMAITQRLLTQLEAHRKEG